MNDWENNINLGESLCVTCVDELSLHDAGYGGDANFRRIKGDMCRIVGIKQILAGIVNVPLALFINAQQHHVETAFIDRIDDIFGRLQ